jgi:phospholipid transport system transporter-binding protein
VISLPAVLTHSESAAFAQSLASQVASSGQQVQVDASALRSFDSSALAVLLSVRRAALAERKAFHVSNLPARLGQLAGLYGVAELLAPDLSPT